MTDEQYLDAISCPRIDPVNQGQKIMQMVDLESIDAPVANALANEDSETEATDLVEEDDSSRPADLELESTERHPNGVQIQADGRKITWKEGIAFGIRPKGQPPDRGTEVRIERLARLICMEPLERQQQFRIWLQKTKGTDGKYSFLNSMDRSYHYFSWRLLENQAGRGLLPAYDAPREYGASTKRGGRRGRGRGTRGAKR